MAAVQDRLGARTDVLSTRVVVRREPTDPAVAEARTQEKAHLGDLSGLSADVRAFSENDNEVSSGRRVLLSTAKRELRKKLLGSLQATAAKAPKTVGSFRDVVLSAHSASRDVSLLDSNSSSLALSAMMEQTRCVLSVCVC